jgi:putative DNA primase/helicase
MGSYSSDSIYRENFGQQISSQEQLLALFHLEMSGILDWAVEGCKKWQEEGLKKPISVIEATEDYKTDVDPTSLWIETRYTGNEADTVPTRLLFDDFIRYARDHDIQLPENYDSIRFGKTIMKKYKSKPKKIDGFRLPN